MALSIPTVLNSTPPETWPPPPPEMTVTTLTEIEGCPRRWALNGADYPTLWGGRGYPTRPHVSALAGSVVHQVLETIMRRLVGAGCGSVADPAATSVLRALGGYTKVLNECIDRVLERQVENPRAVTMLDSVARALRGLVPELRSCAQALLARVRLPHNASTEAVGDASRHKRRGPITSGAFPEIELRAPRLGWKGIADLLVVSDDLCAITDFKTGEADEAHTFQVRVYALLWSLDDQLNPNGRLADRLILAYRAGDVDVPAPTAEQLRELENLIAARRDAAHQALARRPPEARPDPDGCRYCGVRQLCDAYWSAETQRLFPTDADSGFSDVELRVLGRHGSSSWDAVILLSRIAPAGTRALLRVPRGTELQSGAQLRVLNAAVSPDPEDPGQPVVVTLGTHSEMYAALP
jgi:PD-(D/E)XK nuclease superfamily